MADDDKPEIKAASAAKPTAGKAVTATAPAAEEHYEVVSEYRIGEGPPPLFLILCFVFIVTWALFSWVPFFGY